MKERVEITNNSAETQQLAKDLIKELLLDSRVKPENDTMGENRKKAIVIGLEGELGSGKTTFIQGIAEELGIKELVNSPTFVIFKKYAIKKQVLSFKFQVSKFYHFDCYRINSEKDILDLGFKEIISQPENLVVVEWAEKIGKIMPKDCLRIKFSHLGEDKRKIEIGYFKI